MHLFSGPAHNEGTERDSCSTVTIWPGKRRAGAGGQSRAVGLRMERLQSAADDLAAMNAARRSPQVPTRRLKGKRPAKRELLNTGVGKK